MTKNQLKQRINDVYSGAYGSIWDDNVDYIGAELLSRVVPALRDIFGENALYDWVFTLQQLDHFDNVESATEHIWKSIYSKS